jgi:putative transposase
MDWYSRFVLSWEVSITLVVDFCLRALKRSFKHGLPGIFNSDQGSQFTSLSFTGLLEEKKIQISMDGSGRVYDNILIERLWRSVKYEEVYLRDYQDIDEAKDGLRHYFDLSVRLGSVSLDISNKP